MPVSEDPLPDWRDDSVGGAMIRVALWLAAEVRPGHIFTKAQLRKAVPGREQVDRRMRDLRKYGWRIDDYKQDADLKPKELRLVEIGVAVWDPAARERATLATISDRVRQEVFSRDGHRCVRCGAQAGEHFADQVGVPVVLTAAHIYPDMLRNRATAKDLVTACQRCNEALKQHTANYLDADQVWQRIRDKGMADKRRLLAWMRDDAREVSELERLFSQYRQLPAVERERLKDQLQTLMSGADPARRSRLHQQGFRPLETPTEALDPPEPA